MTALETRKWLVYSNGNETLIVPGARIEVTSGYGAGRSGMKMRWPKWFNQPIARKSPRIHVYWRGLRTDLQARPKSGGIVAPMIEDHP